jgi:hypothetical protein
MNSTATVVRFALAILGVATLVLAFVGWEYHYDVKQLEGFYQKRQSVEMQLRALRVCLDMLDNPKRWKNTNLQPPCGYDSIALEELIPEYEDALRGWDQTISDRKALLKSRKSGLFWFVANAVDAARR